MNDILPMTIATWPNLITRPLPPPYLYIYIYIYTYLSIYTSIYCLSVYIHNIYNIYMYISIYVYICVCGHMFISNFEKILLFLYIYVHIFIYILYLYTIYILCIYIVRHNDLKLIFSIIISFMVITCKRDLMRVV